MNPPTYVKISSIIITKTWLWVKNQAIKMRWVNGACKDKHKKSSRELFT